LESIVPRDHNALKKVSAGEIWFAKNKRAPTFREVATGCLESSIYGMDDKYKIKNYQNYWKQIIKASNIDDPNKEIKLEDL
jgi:hypothetical protein